MRSNRASAVVDIHDPAARRALIVDTHDLSVVGSRVTYPKPGLASGFVLSQSTSPGVAFHSCEWVIAEESMGSAASSMMRANGEGFPTHFLRYRPARTSAT